MEGIKLTEGGAEIAYSCLGGLQEMAEQFSPDKGSTAQGVAIAKALRRKAAGYQMRAVRFCDEVVPPDRVRIPSPRDSMRWFSRRAEDLIELAEEVEAKVSEATRPS